MDTRSEDESTSSDSDEFTMSEDIESTDSSGDCWSENEQKNSRKRKKRMMRRKCRKNGQNSRPTVNSSDQETPCKSPASSPSISNKVRENIMESPTLPVTCGDKKGMLYKDKYNNGEPCILSGDQWFTPSKFEKFGGKERNKKWKTSIFYREHNLQTLIQEGLLSSPSFHQSLAHPVVRRALFNHRKKRRGTADAAVIIILDISSSDDDQVAPSQFQGDSFPVRCSEGMGMLHKHRFANETRGKCIRTEEAWLTPAEFLSHNLENGNWRRDITSHGEPLGHLINMRVLKPDAVNCGCSTCRGENMLEQRNDDVCFHCNNEGDLVCCETCPRAFHHGCLDPPLQSDTLSDEWICCFCTRNGSM